MTRNRLRDGLRARLQNSMATRIRVLSVDGTVHAQDTFQLSKDLNHPQDCKR